jgi:hypothetical protein
VYLYAAVFGIVYTLIVNKICIKKAIKVNSDDRNSSNVSSSSKNSKISAHKNTKNHNLLTFPKSHPMNQTSTTSNLLSLLGTSILFSTFIFTSNNLIVYNPVGTKLSYFSIIWSISSSVLGTYLGSLIVGGGRVGVKETIVGVISGGVIMGSVAPIFINIGLTLFLGFLAGFINGVIYKLFYSLINKVIIYDYMGLLIPLLINSLLGSIFIPIAVFLTYSIQKASIPGLTTTPSSSSSNNNNS